MFSTVLFAAFLTVLWSQHEGGCARLWLLPLLMAAWVNVHLGFVAGLGLMGGYVLVEALEMVWPERRQAAAYRLRHAWPWLAATVAATLVNALFAEVVVVVGGAVPTSVLAGRWEKIRQARFASLAVVSLVYGVVGLGCLRAVDLISNRSYLGGTNLSTFGTGLSWWFPESAAAFVERENVPGRIFNSYDEGGYLSWRLGPKYPDYIDGRAIPFGPKLFERNQQLMTTPTRFTGMAE